MPVQWSFRGGHCRSPIFSTARLKRTSTCGREKLLVSAPPPPRQHASVISLRLQGGTQKKSSLSKSGVVEPKSEVFLRRHCPTDLPSELMTSGFICIVPFFCGSYQIQSAQQQKSPCDQDCSREAGDTYYPFLTDVRAGRAFRENNFSIFVSACSSVRPFVSPVREPISLVSVDFALPKRYSREKRSAKAAFRNYEVNGLTRNYSCHFILIGPRYHGPFF